MGNFREEDWEDLKALWDVTFPNDTESKEIVDVLYGRLKRHQESHKLILSDEKFDQEAYKKLQYFRLYNYPKAGVGRATRSFINNPHGYEFKIYDTEQENWDEGIDWNEWERTSVGAIKLMDVEKEYDQVIVDEESEQMSVEGESDNDAEEESDNDVEEEPEHNGINYNRFHDSLNNNQNAKCLIDEEERGNCPIRVNGAMIEITTEDKDTHRKDWVLTENGDSRFVMFNKPHAYEYN